MGPEAEDRSQTALPATAVGLVPAGSGGHGGQTRHASATVADGELVWDRSGAPRA
jgi:hypothetical protein